MNRRLGESQQHRILKRYKTADTRISNSHKLPPDFFSSKKSLSLIKQQSVHDSWLPSVKLSLGKSKSMEGHLKEKSPNFQITFRPLPTQQKWKMPSIGIPKKPESQKIKRISRTKVQTDMKFSDSENLSL